MLGLAKGQYTLLLITPGTFHTKPDFHTVAAASNTMTLVSTTFPLAVTQGATQYLVLDRVPRGLGAASAFIAPQVTRERALEAARGPSPMGLARGKPIQ